MPGETITIQEAFGYLYEANIPIVENIPKIFSIMRETNPELSSPEMVTKNEIQRRATRFSEAIFRDWHQLHRILELHEETIRKRWVKKNIRQRQHALQAAYPSIPSHHRPDYRALNEETLAQRLKGSRFRDVFLNPELNLEHLVNPKNLLLLLNSRGRNMPDAFIYYDLEKAELGVKSQAIVAPFLLMNDGGYTMYFTGRTDPQSYGQLVPWRYDANDEFDALVTGIEMIPGFGTVALEGQHKMLDFLLKCAQSITHDLPLDGDPVPEPPSLDTLTVDPDLSSIASYATGTSYRIPVQFDGQHLTRLARARLNQAHDHLWSLREDPAYFRETILEWSEHHAEHIPMEQAPTEDLGLLFSQPWNKIITAMINDAYYAVISWTFVMYQLVELEVLRTELGADLAPDRILPLEYDTHMSHLRFLLHQMLQRPISHIQYGALGSPPFRKFFVRSRSDSRDDPGYKIHPLPHSSKPQIVERILSLGDSKHRSLCGTHNLLDEIDRLLRQEPEEQTYVTPWVLNHLSDMGIISEFLRQIAYHRPKIGLRTQEADLTAEFNDKIGSARPVFVAMIDMRKAEAELDLFWETLEAAVKRRIGVTPNEWFGLIMIEKKLERTPEWVEPVRASSNEAKALISSLDTKNALLDLQLRTESTLGPEPGTSVKQKEKTRGVAHPDFQSSPADSSAIAPTTPRPTPIVVTQRAHKIFTRVFFTPSPDRTPGEVPWTDLLYAMTTAGCSAKRLMGSAWMFARAETKETKDAGSIIFHEPHPAANIPIHQLRKHGRRLGRRWGWSIDSFIIQSK